MSNVFQEVLTNAEGVQDRLLGPTYAYYKNIRTPKEIGMSDEGTMSALGNDEIIVMLADGFAPALIKSVERPEGDFVVMPVKV